jgi:hypothetical protein
LKNHDFSSRGVISRNLLFIWMGEGGLLQFLDGDVAYCLLEDQTLKRRFLEITPLEEKS